MVVDEHPRDDSRGAFLDLPHTLALEGSEIQASAEILGLVRSWTHLGRDVTNLPSNRHGATAYSVARLFSSSWPQQTFEFPSQYTEQSGRIPSTFARGLSALASSLLRNADGNSQFNFRQ